MPIQTVRLGQPQDQAELDSIQRRRQLAEMLSQQSMEPVRSAAPNAPVSWTQGLAKVLKAHYGKKGMERAEQEQQELAQRSQERTGADTALLAQALQGRPAQPAGLTEDAAGNVTQQDAMPAQTPVQSLGQAIPMMGQGMQPVALQAMMGAQGRQDQQAFQAAQAKERSVERMEAQQRNADLQRELVQLRADVGGDRPFYQFLQTPEGYMAGNARTGTAEPVRYQGKSVMPSQSSPQLQGQLAQEKAAGKERGEATTQAQIDLPRVVDNANNALSIIDRMIGSEDGKTKPHPGFQSYVGATLIPGMRFVEGSDTASFGKFLDQSKGGAFLEAFNSLKGGGQITEIEGKKATDAITRMDKAQSESEFTRAARDYQNIIRLGVKRAQQKAGQRVDGPDRRGVPAGVDPSLWSVMTPEERALWSR